METQAEPMLLLKWIPKSEEHSGHIAARVALRNGRLAENIEEFTYFDPDRPKLTELAHIGFSIALSGIDDRAFWNDPRYYPESDYIDLREMRRGARVLGRIAKTLNERAEKRGRLPHDAVASFIYEFAFAAGLQHAAFCRVEGTFDQYDGPIEWITGSSSYEINDWIRQLHAKYNPKA